MVVSLDPLLVGLTAGLVLENASPVGGERVVHETRPATAPVFALFFGVVGAEIHLRNFLEMAGWALAAACVRAGAFVIGSQHGARVAGVPRSLSRLVPFGMLPQAGVALALADLLASSPQAWARGIAPLVFATIVVNELTGPILFRAALVRSGEIGAKDRPRIELPAPEAIRRVR
jgi:Kef-type K+ transport system membrane component KefB